MRVGAAVHPEGARPRRHVEPVARADQSIGGAKEEEEQEAEAVGTDGPAGVVGSDQEVGSLPG